MSGRYAALAMYVAPQPVQAANEQWLTRIMQLLGDTRADAQGLELSALFRAPELLLTQTCGYPLMTQLRDQVQLIGRPHYEWPHSTGGSHCSVIVCREQDPRRTLTQFRGCRAVINDEHSNSGMNLFRHQLAPLQQGGRFFSSVTISGAHQHSLRWVQAQRADLAAIDSVTFAYLAHYAPQEVAGIRIVARTAPSPTLPFITSIGTSAQEVQRIRTAMNAALEQLPQVGECLGLREVLPASLADYECLLDYQREATLQGFEVLQ